jgi:hypothetical protein
MHRLQDRPDTEESNGTHYRWSRAPENAPSELPVSVSST